MTFILQICCTVRLSATDAVTLSHNEKGHSHKPLLQTIYDCLWHSFLSVLILIGKDIVWDVTGVQCDGCC